MPLSPRAVFSRRSGVDSRPISDGAVVVNMTSGMCFELNRLGAEIWELPGTVVHAKVVVADDVVSFGTVNLDAWALYRNSEIMMIARSPALATLMEDRLFAPDIARCKRGEPSTRVVAQLNGRLWNKAASFL